MSGGQEITKRRRPPKMYLVASDHKVQDQLEGTIRLLRGNLCQEQEGGRGDQLWVKVLDTGSVVKIDKQVLVEVSADLAGLLEPVAEPESRLKLFANPQKLQRLAALPLGTPIWVKLSQSGELAEAELRFRGPLTRGSTAVFFGVQLKGAAMGRGSSNGSHKSHQLFICPEACALFLPANRVVLRRGTRSGAAGEQEREQVDAVHRSRSNRVSAPPTPGGILPRTANSAPAPQSSPPLQVGQRVCFPIGDTVQNGEVRYCGPLPGHSMSLYVGILLDSAVGSWDGFYKGDKLCSIPSPQYGHLLPLSKVSLEPRAHRSPPPISLPKPSPIVKVALKPPPLPHPKPSAKPLPPLPPLLTASKPQAPPSPTANDQPLRANPPPAAPLLPVQSPEEIDDEEETVDAGLEVGSMVEVNEPPLYGVIRWIGRIGGVTEAVAGIELDQELTAATDGSYLGQRHFRCPANKGLFVKLRNCRRDSRFPAPETPVNQVDRCNSIAFAEWGSERVEENTPPLSGAEAKELYDGWKRGIQGHLNSCYLDASLFSMFSCCSSVDWVLLRPPTPQDGPSCSHAQDLLRYEIVNPLRRFGYVCASKTMALRRMLEADSTDTGFTSQEKDPEEFLNKLFHLLRVEPLLMIRSTTQQTQECHLFQLFPPSVALSPPSPTSPLPLSPSIPLSSPAAGLMRVASVQTLLETSFLHAGLKFAEAPSCLPLLMPRFGRDFKMYDAILPSLTLDITDLLDDTVRQCSICQAVAEWECFQCYDDQDITPGCLKQYCQTCNTQVHNHRKRQSHTPAKVGVPGGPWKGPLQGTRQQFSLFAVTCIETSHYVSFVKHGPTPADWLFFDSMADREGGENGFNVPQVRPCPEVGRYLSLSEEELSRLDPSSLRDSVRRLLCDSYMCLYHCPQLSLYK